MGQPYKLGTFDNQGCTYDSWFLAWSSKKKHHPYSSDNNNTDPTGKSFPRGTGWLWRPFWRNGWWNLCNPHIMWSDCSWKKQSRRLWTSDSRKIYWVGLKKHQCYSVLHGLVTSCWCFTIFDGRLQQMTFPWYSRRWTSLNLETIYQHN